MPNTSLDDILTALKNLVTATNAQTQATVNIAGSTDFWGLTAATVVKGSAGRMVRVTVMVTGAAPGTIYDAVSTADKTRPIYTIANTATGSFLVDIPCQYGIVVAPGSGQTVSGSFS